MPESITGNRPDSKYGMGNSEAGSQCSQVLSNSSRWRTCPASLSHRKKDLGMFKIKQNFNDEEFYNIAA